MTFTVTALARVLGKGYKVAGLVNGQRNSREDSFSHLFPEVTLVQGDLTDFSSLLQIVHEIQPDEIYNLGAISFVGLSFKQPELTANVTGLGALRLLEAVRKVGGEKNMRFYQASSSEMFGKVRETPQTELTPFHPRSPYGVAKTFAHYTCVNYREAYGMHISSGILFNHESPLRGETFVTRKITRGISQIALGMQDTLYMGNIDSQRDWGHAKDYVEAMWLMLQQETPDDFVISTGVTTAVRDFIKMAFEEEGVTLEFSGVGVEEMGVVKTTSNPEYDFKVGQVVIRIDPAYFRPTEVDLLIGDNTKAKTKLGWKPKYTLPMLVKEMMNSDIDLFKKEKYLKNYK